MAGTVVQSVPLKGVIGGHVALALDDSRWCILYVRSCCGGKGTQISSAESGAQELHSPALTLYIGCPPFSPPPHPPTPPLCMAVYIACTCVQEGGKGVWLYDVRMSVAIW